MLNHRFNCLIPDDPADEAAGKVLQDRDWNDEHILDTPANTVLYTGTGGSVSGEAGFAYDPTTNILTVQEADLARTVTTSPTGTFGGIRSVTTFSPSADAPDAVPLAVMGKVLYTAAAGNMTGGAAHTVPVVGWTVVDAVGRTLTQAIGTEGKLSVLAGTVLVGTVAENQVEDNDGTINLLVMTNQKVISNTGTIGLMFGSYITVEFNSGTIGNVTGLHYPDFRSVPGGGSITTKKVVANEDPEALITTVGLITGSHGAEIAAPAHPGIATSRYYSSPHKSITPFAMTANLLFGVPFFCPLRKTFNRIGFQVTTLTAGNARLGIYKAGTAGGPAVRILDAGTISTGTTGEKEITISQQLEPGLYFLGIVTDNTCTINWHESDAGWYTMMYGATTATAVNELCLYIIHAFGVLPDPFGTPSLLASTFEPHLWLRAV